MNDKQQNWNFIIEEDEDPGEITGEPQDGLSSYLEEYFSSGKGANATDPHS